MVGPGGTRLLAALLALSALAPIAQAGDGPEAPPEDPPKVPTGEAEEIRETVEDAADDLPVPPIPASPDAEETVDGARQAASDAVDTAQEARNRARQRLADIVGMLPLGTIGQTADDVQNQANDLLSPPPPEEETSRIETNEIAADVGVVSQDMLVAGGIVVASTAAAVLVGVWLAGASSLSGTGGSAAAGKAAFDLRRLLPVASPLFTRFEKDTVLGHPKREALYALILQEPGVSLQALGERLNLSRTAVTHHLRLLEHQHLVVSRRVGRGRHYYENGGRYGHDQKEAYALLRNDRSRAVAVHIKDHPGTIQREMCEALGLGASIAHWHVERLREAGLVEAVRRGRTVAYYPSTAMQECLSPRITALAAQQPALPQAPAAAAPVATPSPVAAFLAAAALPN